MATRARSDNTQRGFTLIEMIIVIAMISILVGIAIPIYKTHVLHAREAVLKEDLFTLRQAIEQFTQDKTRAPQSLDDVVAAGYLKVIPKDPMTGAADWQVVQEDVNTAIDQTQTGIDDVHSNSSLMSTDGTAYSSW
ncbi:MAG TPA: prepilin-type N-terminal cleavage/methylation domain-containing protein [Verrucomicrobiae bacterium]|jgi:general secretion pathway protein G|nr:prepilin-type N-terminal cleavage/methylation domain-containing protein [Verrucomicrobiae bacterium]